MLIVADEVITGFGRTGNMFGCQTYDIAPDFMVVSKALTSSYFPLTAILFTDKIYQTLADNSAKIGVFAPWLHRQRPSRGNGDRAGKSRHHRGARPRRRRARGWRRNSRRGCRSFADHPLVGEARGVGLIGALEFVADKATKAAFDPPGSLGAKLAELCHEEGLIIRAIGDVDRLLPAADHHAPRDRRYVRSVRAGVEAAAGGGVALQGGNSTWPKPIFVPPSSMDRTSAPRLFTSGPSRNDRVTKRSKASRTG